MDGFGAVYQAQFTLHLTVSQSSLASSFCSVLWPGLVNWKIRNLHALSSLGALSGFNPGCSSLLYVDIKRTYLHIGHSIYSASIGPSLTAHPPPRLWRNSPQIVQGLFILVASQSSSDAQHSVGLLWTSDQPDAEATTWQRTTLKRDIRPCRKRD